jgi:hypothetical protein
MSPIVKLRDRSSWTGGRDASRCPYLPKRRLETNGLNIETGVAMNNSSSYSRGPLAALAIMFVALLGVLKAVMKW